MFLKNLGKCLLHSQFAYDKITLNYLLYYKVNVCMHYELCLSLFDNAGWYTNDYRSIPINNTCSI